VAIQIQQQSVIPVMLHMSMGADVPPFIVLVSVVVAVCTQIMGDFMQHNAKWKYAPYCSND